MAGFLCDMHSVSEDEYTTPSMHCKQHATRDTCALKHTSFQNTMQLHALSACVCPPQHVLCNMQRVRKNHVRYTCHNVIALAYFKLIHSATKTEMLKDAKQELFFVLCFVQLSIF